MDMPHPTDQHRQLEKLAGAWQGAETIGPSPWDAGGEAEGAVNNRVALDGFAVIQDYEQKRDGHTSFRGHGVFQYNSQADEYIMHWWDSMGMGVNEFRGRFDGDILTVVGPTQGGQARCVFDVSRPGSYRFVMDVSNDGQNWNNFMTGEYVRRAERAAAAAAPARKSAPKAAAKKRSAAPARKKSAGAKKKAKKAPAKKKARKK